MARQIGPVTKSGKFRSKSKRRSKRKKASGPKMIQTTQRVLPIVAENASTTGFNYQVDRGLSQMNKKLYRQGMNYHCRVHLNSDGSADNDTEYKIYTLPKDHRTIGAMRMARDVYNQAVKDELQIRPEVKTPWTDFKIKLDGTTAGHGEQMITEQARTTFQANLLSSNFFIGESTSDAYLYSQVTDAAGVQRFFSMSTDLLTTDGWDIWAEYRNYLLNRADPDSAAEIPAYGDASAVLTEMAELADKGDEPPYAWNQTYSRGGVANTPQELIIVLAGTISAGISTRQQVSQFVDVEAPLGFIFVETSGNYLDVVQPELTVTAKPGNYKGVKADLLYPKDKLLGF